MVEVFKTNVRYRDESIILVEKLRQHFPEGFINFDLEDCDHILRVEGLNLSTEKIIGLMKEYGYACEALD